MSRNAGPICRQLREAIDAGVRGTYHVLAQAAGVEPQVARCALKEMSRRGEYRAAPRSSRGEPAIYEPVVPVFDALAHVRSAWR